MGCIFSPHKDDSGNKPPPPIVYPILANPELVLEALKTAYEARDSVEIGKIYDINYQGTSFDPADLSSLPFTRQDEIRHVQGLYRSTSILSISFNLPPSVVRERDLSDPPGWSTIHIQNMAIFIDDRPTSYNLIANGTWEFKFIPTAPDSTSPTDTTWKIVRWTELP